MESSASSTPTNRCPRCGAAFACGMETGEKTCWCAELPAITPPAPGAGCYCPDCLRALIAEQTGRS